MVWRSARRENACSIAFPFVSINQFGAMQEFAPDSRFARQVRPSPNHDERTLPADMLLLHYTGMTSTAVAIERLCDPAAKVSSHYVAEESGNVLQLVPETRRAWHAGLSSWEGVSDVNARSIGIEIANPGHSYGYPDFPEAQIMAVIALCRDIVARHRIRADRVLAHSDVAPQRKLDPGEKFPWATAAPRRRRRLGRAVADPARRRACARRQRRRCRRSAGRAPKLWLWHRGYRRVRRSDRGGGDGISAPLPGGSRRRPR